MKSKKRKANIPPGHNADRSKCSKCQFRGNQKNGCDFIETMQFSRRCRIEDCDKFIEGPRLTLKEAVMGDLGYSRGLV